VENNNSKVVTVCLMLFSILIGIVVAVILETASAVGTGAFGRAISNQTVRTVLPVAIGLIIFAILQTNKKVVAWSDDVVSEIRRIVWPSRRDTIGMTVVVCIMLLISGVALGLLDVLSGSFIDWLLHRNIAGLF
jgi:preprotein translocase subunit SecE